MAIDVQIKFTQGVTTAPAGEALFGVVGQPVVASLGNYADVQLLTIEVVDAPPTSVLAPGVKQDKLALQTYTFTPDVPGGYLISVTGYDKRGVSKTDRREFGVKLATGRHIPSFKADFSALNYSGNTRGSAKFLEEWLYFLDAFSGANTSVPSIKNPARAALTVALAANTVNAGAGTITGNANGAIPAATSDNVTLVAGDRLVVTNTGHATAAARGLYTVSQQGTGGQPFILTRATDADEPGELITGTRVRVNEGTVNAGVDFVLTTTGIITIGVTGQSWSAVGLSGTVGGSLAGTLPNPTVTQLDGVAGVATIVATRTVMGPTGRQVVSDDVEVATTNATPTAVVTYALADNTTTSISGTFLGKNTANGDSYEIDARGVWSRTGGGAPVVQRAVSTSNEIKVGTLATASATYVLSSNNVSPTVTGVVATNIKWSFVGNVVTRGN